MNVLSLARVAAVVMIVIATAGCDDTDAIISTFPNSPSFVGVSAGNVTGVVFDRAGVPVSGARITAQPNWQLPFRVSNWPPPELSTVISGPDGRFAFRGLPFDVPFFVFPNILDRFNSGLLQRCGVNVVLRAEGGAQVFTMSSSFDLRHPVERALAALSESCGLNQLVVLTP